MLISPIFVTQKCSQRLILKYIWQEIFNKANYASQNKSCLKILCIYMWRQCGLFSSVLRVAGTEDSIQSPTTPP